MPETRKSMNPDFPLRWRVRLPPGTKVCGRTPEYLYGCYFPTTDLNVAEHGGRGTGRPTDVEWAEEAGRTKDTASPSVPTEKPDPPDSLQVDRPAGGSHHA